MPPPELTDHDPRRNDPRRNDPRMLLARLVAALVTYVPFMLVQGVLGGLLPAGWATAWTVFVVYYSATRVPYIAYDWLTTFWHADAAGVTVRTGWLHRETVTVAWADVASLRVKQNVVQRALRIHHMEVVLGAEGRSTLVLEALTDADVARLAALHGVPIDTAATTVTTDPDADATAAPAASGVGVAEPTGDLLYRAHPRDFSLIGFTHGQFLLVVPFVLGGGADVLEWVGVDTALLLAWANRGGPWLTALAVLMIAFAYGTLRASLTYRGYRVHRTAEGYVSAGGFLRSDRREASLRQVVGVRVTRNPLMQLTGHCSVDLVLATGRGESKPLPILPLVRVRDLAPHLVGLVPADEPEVASRRPWAEPAASVLVGALAAWACWVWVGPWLAALVAVVALWGANALSATVARTATVVRIESGVVGRTTRIIHPDAVRTAWFAHPDAPWRSGRGWLKLVVLDRRARHHLVPGVPRSVARAFDVSADAVGPQVAQQRDLGEVVDRFAMDVQDEGVLGGAGVVVGLVVDRRPAEV